MKQVPFLRVVLLSLLGFAVACKENNLGEGIVPYVEPATTDATGGTWRTVLLPSAYAVPVAAPIDVNSSAYQSLLTGIKNVVQSLTPEQNTAVSYWAQGGVLRWNQIARQLVAKYNVETKFNTQTGQYDPTSGETPVSTLPQAARIYALLSAAQYDALVVAWKAKYQYNVPSLSKQGIINRVPLPDLPSYPSEGAALADASVRVLLYFFPEEGDFLVQKAFEHKQSCMWSGAAVSTDVQAGEKIGVLIGDLATARARHNPFSNVPYTLPAQVPYDVMWKSLALPSRLPDYPAAANAIPWFDGSALNQLRPAAPPRTTDPAFQTALDEVRQVAKNRSREQFRQADYWYDGPATYTPAGHWNLLAEDLIRQGRQNELRTARTYSLLNRAMQDAVTVAWWSKYTYWVPRPQQIDPAISASVIIPNSPAYADAHAAVASSATAVLAALFPTEADALSKKGAEAVGSQLVAGTQYRFSSEAGAAIGQGVGKLAAEWAKTDGAQ